MKCLSFLGPCPGASKFGYMDSVSQSDMSCEKLGANTDSSKMGMAFSFFFPPYALRFPNTVFGLSPNLKCRSSHWLRRGEMTE